MKQVCLIAATLLLFNGFVCATSKHPKPVDECACTTAGKQAPQTDQRGTESSPLSIKLLNTGENAAEAAEKADAVKHTEQTERWTVDLTFVLVGATILQFGALLWQGWQIRRQITLAHEEFVASHRPKFVIREPHLAVIHCPADPPEKVDYQIRFALTNAGETEGTLVESFVVVMEMSKDGWTHLGVEGTHDFFGHIALPAGGHREITIDMRPKISETITKNLTFHRQYPEWNEILFLRGTVVYGDENGINRRTAFCRHLEYSTLRFRRTDDPDYEYCD